jgi:hypothetical protein
MRSENPTNFEAHRALTGSKTVDRKTLQAWNTAIHTAKDISPERKAEIDGWIHKNAVAHTEILGLSLDSDGGENVSRALNGNSSLKKLSPVEQRYLIEKASEKQRISGDTEAIREAAENLKSLETRAIVAEAYATPAAEVYKHHAHGGQTVSTGKSVARHEMLKVATRLDRKATIQAFEKVEPGLSRIIEQSSPNKGPGWISAPRKAREAGFVLRHPIAYQRIGRPILKKAVTNISTNAIRFSTNNLGLKENRAREGSQVNAFRHTLWQAQISSEFGVKIASELGNAHEENPFAVQGFQDYENKPFHTLKDADETVDLLNNRIGRKLGAAHPNATMKENALRVLDYYRDHGLWVAEKQSNGTYKIKQQKLSQAQYQVAAKRLAQLDKNGFAIGDKYLSLAQK